MDANEILDSAYIFQYKGRPSYAGFANYFRYKLLLERGGWWADTDTICLKPFDFPDDYVFSSEIDYKGREVVNAGVIKTAPGSEIMAYAWGVCQKKDPPRLVWGETGPRLMAKAVKKFALGKFKKSYQTFCPVDYEQWSMLVQPNLHLHFDDCTYAIHLWNEMWRAAGQDKNAPYHPTCLYERLKEDYLRSGETIAVSQVA
jgi:mannosyltransferase OCH1-like enzyme